MIEKKDTNNESHKNFNFKTFTIKALILSLFILAILHFENVAKSIGIVIGLIIPYIFGFALVYIWSLVINPMERFISNRIGNTKIVKFKRPITVLLSLLVFFAILAFILYLVIPQLVQSFKILTENLPKVAEDLKQYFLDFTKDKAWAISIRDKIMNFEIDWEAMVKDYSKVVGTSITGVLGSTFNFLGNVTGFLLAAFQTIMFALYLISKKEKIGEQINRVMKAYVSEEKRNKIYYVLNIMDDTFASFFKGQVLDAFIIGVLLFITLSIFGMPYALAIGVVVMVTALIPIVGALIGGAVGFVMIASVDFNQALLFLLLLIIVQQLEGDLIYPKIVGDSIGLPAIWVFVAVMVGGSLFGPLGMIIAVPLFATAYKLLRNDVNSRVHPELRANLPDDYKKMDDKEYKEIENK